MGSIPGLLPSTQPGPLPQKTGMIAPGTDPNAIVPGGPSIGKASGGVATVSPYYSGTSQDFAKWLTTQIGAGATPFNAQSPVPSTGGLTAPGQLTADPNQIIQMLQAYFNGTGGPSKLPGADTLKTMATTGDPITALPAWKDAVAAMDQNTKRNAANLREQFAGTGTLSGSPYGTAAANFQEQTTKDQNALLSAAQQASLEAAAGRKLDASKTLLASAYDFSKYLQGLDQASIDATIKEFLRTQPEYSPLLNMLFSMATMFGPTVGKTQTGGIIGTIISDMTNAAAAVTGAHLSNPQSPSGGSGGFDQPGVTVT